MQAKPIPAIFNPGAASARTIRACPPALLLLLPIGCLA